MKLCEIVGGEDEEEEKEEEGKNLYNKSFKNLWRKLLVSLLSAWD